MKILAIIPARGGSKGIPKKNVATLLGKPLIAWTIEAAKKSKYVNRTVVSSNDDKILRISESLGADTVKRPESISKDNSAYRHLIVHLLKKVKKGGYMPDIIIYLQPTSPLRTSFDIDKAISYMLSKKAESLASVYKLSNKYLKSFVLNGKGYLRGAVKDKYPSYNRQDLPELFMPNGAIYAVKTKTFLKYKDLICPKTIPFLMSMEKSIDIDGYQDLKKVEKILKSSIH